MKIFRLSTLKSEIYILFVVEKVHILRVEYAIVGVRFFKKTHLLKINYPSPMDIDLYLFLL